MGATLEHGIDAEIDNLPLVVDLDGTLCRVDLLEEGLFRAVLADPCNAARALGWLARGKAHLKHQVAGLAFLDAARLPYSQPFLDFLRAEHARGRTLCLATGSDRAFANDVAERLGIFTDILASDGHVNLTGAQKAQKLAERFAGGFVYAGNSRADVAVWKHARAGIVVNASPGVARAAEKATRVVAAYPASRPAWSAWVRALRPHQWVKNLLVTVPLLTSHRCFEIALALPALAIFAVFCLCASAIYVVNDLVDLDADRRHATKCRRPFAAGEIGVAHGLIGAMVLMVSGLGLAAILGPPTLLLAAGYVVASVAYSVWFKSRLIFDVFVLASLYVIRVIAGGVALGVPLSSWLIGFCGFCFLSLSFAKRYLELRRAADRAAEGGPTSIPGRAYLSTDRDMIGMFGVGAAMAAAVLLTLYVASDAVKVLYRGPELLWLLVPLLLYWKCRLWTIAHRGHLHDDPVLFAVRDRVTYLVAVSVLIVMAAASTVDLSAIHSFKL